MTNSTNAARAALFFLAAGSAACTGADTPAADSGVANAAASASASDSASASTSAAASVAASASIVNAAGENIGTATFRMEGNALRVDMTVRGLPAGAHGVHLHAVGKCEGPSFTSAGGHANPSNAQHGMKNPAGPHAGDLPNVTGGETTSYTAQTTRMTIEAGENSLFDADGTAIVIHADPDDDVTDPSGNSGDRIACGVITRGA